MKSAFRRGTTSVVPQLQCLQRGFSRWGYVLLRGRQFISATLRASSAYTGSLLAEVERETESKLYKVSLFPKIKVLFEPANFTYLQWQDRKTLIRAPLAQWLHS